MQKESPELNPFPDEALQIDSVVNHWLSVYYLALGFSFSLLS
jgi:hypothetical protein